MSPSEGCGKEENLSCKRCYEIREQLLDIKQAEQRVRARDFVPRTIVWVARYLSHCCCKGQYLNPGRQQKLHPIFEELAKNYGQYWCIDILSKLARLGQRKQVCLQWIPSHVGVPGNKAADELASRGCDLSNPSSTVLSR
ncbi:RNase H domain-containing protein [Trichonephila clavipes]|nr:RNase H domain-containing protein [Trichonephila clavipes]